MIGADKIDDIRRLGRGGASVASIARDTGVSEPTAGKCLRETDLSERPPAVGRAPESPLPGPFAALVDSWLLEDRRCWYKQRHTAKRVFDRLVAEEGFEGSYSTVRRCVRRRREELAAEPGAREAQGFLPPGWLPGECQVDFGQADFRVRGVVTRGHFLVVTFPHSNVGLAQVFWGETAECVCQGLRSVFEFLGGVPLRAVFDNATEVGRRVGAEIRTSGLFRRFAAHHGLDHGLASPRSGNEKGSRGEQGRRAQAQPLRPGPAGLGREGPRRAAARRVPGALGRQAAPPQGRARARALRGRPRGALAAAGGPVRVRDVARQEVRQAGLVRGRGRAPPLGGPRQRLPRGRRRDGRLRRRGRRRRRRGRRRAPARVGRRADGPRRPHAAAEAAPHAPGRLARQRRARVAARGARGVPRPGGRPPTSAWAPGRCAT